MRPSFFRTCFTGWGSSHAVMWKLQPFSLSNPATAKGASCFVAGVPWCSICPNRRRRWYFSRQAAASHFHDTDICDQYHYSVNNCVRCIDARTVCMYICMHVLDWVCIYIHICICIDILMLSVQSDNNIVSVLFGISTSLQEALL